MRNKLNIWNNDDNFVLGHGYEVDVSCEYKAYSERSKYFEDMVAENEKRVKLGLQPLSTSPHKHIVDEGRVHGSSKDFIRFKRNKLMKQKES